MPRTPKVDVSEAVRRLGIDHPVKIESANLNHGLPAELADAIFNGTTQGKTVSADTIQLDWDAMAYTAREGADPKYWDPAQIVAHELIHIRQIQEAGGWENATQRYVQAGTLDDGSDSYKSNPFEVDAFNRQAEISKYVRFS